MEYFIFRVAYLNMLGYTAMTLTSLPLLIESLSMCFNDEFYLHL